MKVDEKLALCYDIIMMSSRSGLLNARGVRTGYTHWLGPELSKEVRMFSGYVSQKAIDNGSKVGLVLEHYLRLQTNLTALIQKHVESGENKSEFIAEVKRLERVHIVTREENTVLRRNENSGDYGKVGVELVYWDRVPSKSKDFLKKKLIGNVANASQFLAR